MAATSFNWLATASRVAKVRHPAGFPAAFADGTAGEQIPLIFPVSARAVAESFRVETSPAVSAVPAKSP
jgi:hypothetical protein